MNEIKKYRGYILTAIIGLVVGFFISRGNQVVKEFHTVEWKTQDPIEIEVPYPYPVKETHTIVNEKQVPGEVIRDTIFVIDTVEVVEDYLLERIYSHTFFDSKEQGKLTVNSVVQYNKQKSIGIDHVPVTRVETTKMVVEPIWVPFISAGYDTNNSVLIGGGIFYHDLGFEYNFNQNLNQRDFSHQFKLKLKF